MASYEELFTQLDNQPLHEKCYFALLVAAEAIKDAATDGTVDGVGMNTADHRLWARYALDRTDIEARKVVRLLLADSKNASLAQIAAATDETVQALVDNVLPYLVQSRADR
jgi:hypothetical protein